MSCQVSNNNFVYIANNYKDLIDIILSGSAEINYGYGGSGGIILNGSAAACITTVCVFCKYSPGTMTYLKKKAIKGKLEKVFVKRVHYKTIPRDCSYIGAGDLCIYFDSYNDVYNEEELIDVFEAIQLARSFHENRLAEIS